MAARKIALFDAKPYDIKSFDALNVEDGFAITCPREKGEPCF